MVSASGQGHGAHGSTLGASALSNGEPALAETPVVQENKSEPQNLDLIWGAKNIATAINRTERETFHLLKKKKLPAKKIEGRWISSLEKLRQYFLSDLTV